MLPDDYNPDDEYVEDEFGDGFIVLEGEEFIDWLLEDSYV